MAATQPQLYLETQVERSFPLGMKPETKQDFFIEVEPVIEPQTQDTIPIETHQPTQTPPPVSEPASPIDLSARIQTLSRQLWGTEGILTYEVIVSTSIDNKNYQGFIRQDLGDTWGCPLMATGLCKSEEHVYIQLFRMLEGQVREKDVREGRGEGGR